MKLDLAAIRAVMAKRPPALLVSALLETHLSAAAIEDAGTMLHSIGPLCDRVEELEARDQQAAIEASDTFAKWCELTSKQLDTNIAAIIDRDKTIAELEAEIERLKNKKCVHDLAKERAEQITESKNRLDRELWRHR